MSFQAMAWAIEQPIERSSAKFVLIIIANYANENGTCYPSIARIAEDTAQDRKTVIDNLDWLETQNYIQDTGKRTGHTKSIKVYSIAFKQSQKRDCLKSEAVPIFPISSPEIGMGKQSQKRDTEPISTEPIIKPVPPTPSTQEILKMIETFWSAYPKKRNRVDTEHAFSEVKAWLFLPDILKSIEWQKKSEEWTRENGRWIPMPSSYLREMRWMDEPVHVSHVNHQQKEYMKRSEYIQRLCSQPLPFSLFTFRCILPILFGATQRISALLHVFFTTDLPQCFGGAHSLGWLACFIWSIRACALAAACCLRKSGAACCSAWVSSLALSGKSI